MLQRGTRNVNFLFTHNCFTLTQDLLHQHTFLWLQDMLVLHSHWCLDHENSQKSTTCNSMLLSIYATVRSTRQQQRITNNPFSLSKGQVWWTEGGLFVILLLLFQILLFFLRKKTEGAPPPKIFTVLCPLKVVLLFTCVTSNFTCWFLQSPCK